MRVGLALAQLWLLLGAAAPLLVRALKRGTPSTLRVRGSAIPVVEVNLDLPPRERWLKVVEHYNATIPGIHESFAGDQYRLTDDMKDFYLRTHDGDALAEAEGYAEAAGVRVEALMLFGIGYELNFPKMNNSCAGLLTATQPHGTVVHGRNMDYDVPFQMIDGEWKNLAEITIEVLFTRGGKPLFTSVNWPFQIGVATAMRFPSDNSSVGTDGWSYEQNTRPGNNMNDNFISRKKHGGITHLWAARKAMENAADFDTAVSMINSFTYTAPMYIIMAGAAPYQGTVMTVDRGLSDGGEPLRGDIHRLSAQVGQWYLVQINDDVLTHPAMDLRRYNAINSLSLMGQSAMTEDSVLGLMRTPPLFLPRLPPPSPITPTVYTSVMCPARGTHKTILNDAVPTDSISPWRR